LAAHLWTQAEAPLEYVELILCRDVYHCPPDALPDWDTCMDALAMIDVENQVMNKKVGKKL
jgi:hypothetical protein